MGTRLQDRHCYAMGIAARHIGAWADAYRPKGTSDPLNPQQRFLRLTAGFLPGSGSAKRPNQPGNPFWQGVFDASYTQPGDYLVAPSGTYFIGSQAPLLPVLCVKTNRTIDVARPGVQMAISVNPYGGYNPAGSVAILNGWPASMTTNTYYGQPEAALPADQPNAYLDILLPTINQAVLRDGDIVTDDLGRSAVLVASELTDFGWRLVAKVVTT